MEEKETFIVSGARLEALDNGMVEVQFTAPGTGEQVFTRVVPDSYFEGPMSELITKMREKKLIRAMNNLAP